MKQQLILTIIIFIKARFSSGVPILRLQNRRTGFVLLFLFVNSFFAHAQCPVPGGLNAGTVTGTNITLTWNPVLADSFLLRYYSLEDSVYIYTGISNGSDTSFVLSGLKPNTNYAWQIRTWCNNGSPGAYQNQPFYFATDTQVVHCIAPNKTYHTTVTTNSADIHWNTYILADTFMVRYAVQNTTAYNWIKVPGSQHSATIQGLTPNTNYEWMVRCICVSNPVQAYSAINYFSTFSDSCDAPDAAYFLTTPLSGNSSVISWQPVSNAISYRFRYAERYSGNWNVSQVTNPEVTLTGLSPSTWYEYQVQSICSSGTGVWSAVAIFQSHSGIVALTRGPYLQLSTPNSMYIRWRTDIPVTSQVTYGMNPANLNFSMVNTNETTEHIVQLSGLTEHTRYYYSVGTDAGILQQGIENTFLTNPATGSTDPVRIWAIGDFGRGNTQQIDVRDSYEAYTSNIHTDVWLWLGDNAYNDGTDSEYQTKVFDVYPDQFKKWVTWPASGNHDLHSANSNTQTGPYYDNFTMPAQGEAGGVPSNTEAYYSFDYANIHFVCLESYGSNFRSVSGAMAAWLDADLTANSQTFTIVYFHHPPYSKGSHDSDLEIELVEMRTNIVPILENHKVDLVLAGHSHAYERSILINGHYGLASSFDPASMAMDAGSGTTPNAYIKSAPDLLGTVYVVCGTSGSSGGTSNGWPHQVMHDYSVSYFGSLVIDVNGNQLHCKYLTSTGMIYDEFTMIKPDFPAAAGNDIHPEVSSSGITIIKPNPMTRNTQIEFYLDKAAQVRFDILDPAGRLVYTLDESRQRSKGIHRIAFPYEKAGLSSGIYFIRMYGTDISSTGKILVD